MSETEQYRLTGDNVRLGNSNTGDKVGKWVFFTHADDWAGEGDFTLIQKYVDGRWKNVKLVMEDD